MKRAEIATHLRAILDGYPLNDDQAYALRQAVIALAPQNRCKDCVYFNGHRRGPNGDKDHVRVGSYCRSCDAFGIKRGARMNTTPSGQKCRAFKPKEE